MLLVAFAAGILQGAAGFGFTLAVSPVAALALPGHLVVGTVVRAALAVDVVLACLDGRRVDRRAVAAYAGPAVLAVPVGVLVARATTPAVLAVTAGLAVVAAAVLLHGPGPDIARSRTASGPGAGTAGFAAGLLGVTTGLSGPPLAVHVNRSGVDPTTARGTLAWLFVGIDGMAVMANPSAIEAPHMVLVVVAAVGGTLVGRRHDGAVGPAARRRLSTAVVAGAGIVTVVPVAL